MYSAAGTRFYEAWAAAVAEKRRLEQARSRELGMGFGPGEQTQESGGSLQESQLAALTRDFSDIADIRIEFFAKPDAKATPSEISGRRVVPEYYTDYAEVPMDGVYTLPDWSSGGSPLFPQSKPFSSRDLEELFDLLRIELERCGTVSGFQYFASLRTGWGELAGLIVEEAHDACPKTPVMLYDVDSGMYERYVMSGPAQSTASGSGPRSVPPALRSFLEAANLASAYSRVCACTSHSAFMELSLETVCAALGLSLGTEAESTADRTPMCHYSAYAASSVLASAALASTLGYRVGGYSLDSVTRGLSVTPQNNIYNSVLVMPSAPGFDRGVPLSGIAPRRAWSGPATGEPAAYSHKEENRSLEEELNDCFAVAESLLSAPGGLRESLTEGVSRSLRGQTRQLLVRAPRLGLSQTYPHLFQPKHGLQYRTEIDMSSRTQNDTSARLLLRGMLSETSDASKLRFLPGVGQMGGDWALGLGEANQCLGEALEAYRPFWRREYESGESESSGLS